MEEATEYADNVVLCNGGTWPSPPAMPRQRHRHENFGYCEVRHVASYEIRNVAERG